jgi:hypothetical protein
VFSTEPDRVVEARPAGAALELQLGLETAAVPQPAQEKVPCALLVQQRAAARPLGAVVAHHLVLLGVSLARHSASVRETG